MNVTTRSKGGNMEEDKFRFSICPSCQRVNGLMKDVYEDSDAMICGHCGTGFTLPKPKSFTHSFKQALKRNR